MELIKKNRPRIDYLDIAKAITIFLVMIGHGAETGISPEFKRILYTFHMPLFFMVSGVVTRRHRSSGYGKEHWKEFMKSNLLSLVLPYFLWALIYSAFNYNIIPCILYGSWQTLRTAETLSSLWFLTCLFVARILMELVLMSSNLFKKLDRHLYALIIAAVSFGISFLFPSIEIGYPWCFNSAFSALGFMLVGYAIKEKILLLQKKPFYVHILFLIGFLGLFTFGILIQGEEIFYVNLYSGVYGPPHLFFLNAFSGIGAVLSISVILAKIWEKRKESKAKKVVLWIGKHTIEIFLLHKPLLQQVILKIFAACGVPLPGLLPSICGAVITLPLCCLLILGIERIIPQVFGKFPKRNKLTVTDPEEEALSERTPSNDDPDLS